MNVLLEYRPRPAEKQEEESAVGGGKSGTTWIERNYGTVMAILIGLGGILIAFIIAARATPIPAP